MNETAGMCRVEMKDFITRSPERAAEQTEAWLKWSWASAVQTAEAALRALLARLSKAHDGIEQVIIGRELQTVDTGLGERRAQRILRGLGGILEAASEAAIVGVDEQLLAGLGVLKGQQSEVGDALSAGSVKRIAITSWRRARKPSGFSQPGC